jgi:hypothetical protein
MQSIIVAGSFIDSLPQFFIKKPIPIVIQCVDDNEFVACAPNINVAMSGSSAGEALLLLKEDIQEIYKYYSAQGSLGPEPKRQLRELENHIGKRRE